MGWATYLTASPHTLDNYYRTEALADARITAAAAETPAVALSKKGASDYMLPANAMKGVWVFNSTDSEFKPGAPMGLLDTLKEVVTTVQRQFYGEVYPLIERYGFGFPFAEKGNVEDIILGLKRGFNLDMLDSDLTELARIDSARKVLLGPTEVTGHGTAEGTITLYSAVRGITYPDAWVRGQPLRTLLWNATDSRYDRRTMQASIDAARTDFPAADWPDYDTVDLLSEDWIDTIPAYVNPNP